LLKIENMSQEEMRELLAANNFGHLGCARDNHPYVVPMNYGYDDERLFFFTTEGTKTEYINANREVCFQVEEIKSPSDWRSVMITGRAERVTLPDELERAMQIITKSNPTLTPAINKTEIGSWHRLNNIVVYRVRPEAVYGRKTAPFYSGE
jgi:nitroimidazol reductase NimA-like FMN-containing flavoprotein (pyridoxamine 5'-phosphate oxidase superfamily)